MNRIITEKVLAPINEKLSPEKRLEYCLALSDLMTKMVTYVICHTIVDNEELMKDERIAVANAFLQRVTSTHLSNHKLTKEGIVMTYQGQTFQLHDEYKTMTLTRSAYEHLVMYYFVYVHPKTEEERWVVWNYWRINSKKNLLNYNSEGNAVIAEGEDGICEEIETLRKDIFETRAGMECYHKLDEWTAIGKPTQNGCIEFFRRQGHLDVRRVSYNQAWKHLFGKDHDDMAQLYRHLSIHCHPIYDGLMQYKEQAQNDEGNDGVPLYLSCCFLAYLCSLYLQLIPNGHQIFDADFSQNERMIFKALSQVTVKS